MSAGQIIALGLVAVAVLGLVWYGAFTHGRALATRQILDELAELIREEE